MSNNKNILSEILEQKYPNRIYMESSDSGNQLIIDKINQGYKFTGFISNQKIENKGVKHYIISLNHLGQYKWIERDYSKGYKNASWNIIDGYAGLMGPKEKQFDNLLETILTLQDQKFYANTIQSYFGDILIENDDLLTGLVGIQQKPIIQIIPILHPFKENETIWLSTGNKID